MSIKSYSPVGALPRTVGFHNFNLRIFNLRVSNPNKLIVVVFLTRCRISMCQGLGPKKHDEISEIDRRNLDRLGVRPKRALFLEGRNPSRTKGGPRVSPHPGGVWRMPRTKYTYLCLNTHQLVRCCLWFKQRQSIVSTLTR